LVVRILKKCYCVVLVRFSISLEEGLLARFDRCMQTHQSDNRSGAIRDLIRETLLRRSGMGIFFGKR
jgi:metal-responsive CopG/Arc/MetJ family transcriptional regulator